MAKYDDLFDYKGCIGYEDYELRGGKTARQAFEEINRYFNLSV